MNGRETIASSLTIITTVVVNKDCNFTSLFRCCFLCFGVWRFRLGGTGASENSKLLFSKVWKGQYSCSATPRTALIAMDSPKVS